MNFRNRNIFNSSQIFIFQNCLNELQDNALVPNNLDFLIEEISGNSLLIFADLIGYQQIYSVKNEIKTIIKHKNSLTKEKVNEFMFEIQFPREATVSIRSNLSIPRTIRQNLLIGNPNDIEEARKLLTPRSHVRFSFIGIYKRFSQKIVENLENFQYPELTAANAEREKLKQQMDEVNRRIHYWLGAEREKRTQQFKLLFVFSIVAFAVGCLGVLIAMLALLN